MKPRLALLFVLIAAWPGRADACPICFGGADSPLLDAARLGVLALVAVTVTVLAGFGRWFLKLRALQRQEEQP
jgi:hypothetical protein